MSEERFIQKALEKGDGLLRLTPTWVPRNFLSPSGRLKLAPEDLYALGASRGGIDERWLASTTQADNPGAPPDEGLSYIVVQGDHETQKMLLKNVIEIEGERILGKRIMNKYNGWTVLTKIFENTCPIPLHLHLMDKHARNVNRSPKPEAYYFPRQLNMIEGNFPFTFFGLSPGTTRRDLQKCLEKWDNGDNGILYYSQAYRLKSGTGWVVPAGILHAPGTLVTYEVQEASDVAALYQSMLENKPISWDLLVKDVPKKSKRDLDYILDMIDWEANLDPEFKKHHYIEPKLVCARENTRDFGYEEKWITYGTKKFSAKELTVFPGQRVKIVDANAYGLIVVQGHGMMGEFKIESSTIIRYGELTSDEFFVTFEAAKEGVIFTNESTCENLVILKHFGPGNPSAPNKITYKKDTL